MAFGLSKTAGTDFNWFNGIASCIDGVIILLSVFSKIMKNETFALVKLS